MPILRSQPFLSNVLMAYRLWLATAIINGVFPYSSGLLILAPYISKSSIIGNLFFIAAICKAVNWYFLSIGLFISKFGFLRIFINYCISSTVIYLNAIYYRECGYTVLKRECHAILDVALFKFFINTGSGS